MNEVTVNEVGPRDGLQNISSILNVNQRLELINSLKKSGISSIEIGSFVSSNAVPAMQDTNLLLERLNLSECDYSILIPNQKGYEIAKTNKATTVCLVLCLTESFNKKNINKSIHDTFLEFQEIIKQSKQDKIRTKIYLSGAFECPYEGKVSQDIVIEFTEKFILAGVDEIVIADTIGAANPSEVSSLFKSIFRKFDNDKFSAHFHDTKALGTANVYASLEEGVRKFDSSIGGLGGCPFAPGASGNLATEDLVSLLHDMNFETGIDLKNLKGSRDLASKLTGISLQGRVPI